MSKSNTEDIILNKSDHAMHWIDTHETNIKVPQAGFLFKNQQHHNQKTFEESVDLKPETAVPSSVFTNGGKYAWNIDNVRIHEIKRLLLFFTLTNDDAVAFTHQQNEFKIRQIHYYFGSEHLTSIKPLSLFFLNYVTQTYDEISSLASSGHIDPSDYSAASSTIASSGSQKIYIDITGPLKTMDVYVNAVNSTGKKLRVEVEFEPASTWGTTADAGAIEISVTDCELCVEYTKHLNKYDLHKEEASYNSATPYALRFLEFQEFTKPIANTSGSENHIDFSSIAGLSSLLLICARANSPTGTNLTTFVSLDNLYVTDGTTNIFPQRYKGEYLLRKASQYFPSRFFGNLSVYPFLFAENPYATLTEGVNTGCMALPKEHYVYYTPGASATHDMTVINISLAYLTVRSGAFKTMNTK